MAELPEIPFPVSGGIFEAFLERVRFSPNVKIDIDWLVRCLGITKRPNAGKTLHWLRLAGIVSESGQLTTDGTELLRVPSDRQFQEAASRALERLVAADRLDRLRKGKLTSAQFRDELCTEYEVSAGSGNKAVVGVRVLAEAAGDTALLAALPKTRYRKYEPTLPSLDVERVRRELLSQFQLFTGGTGGIDSWLSENTPEEVFARLALVRLQPLSNAQLNQLLAYSHAPPLTEAFFEYYWLTLPSHTYAVERLPGWRAEWMDSKAIVHPDQLMWGLYRFYVDALLYFGNVRAAYQVLRTMNIAQLNSFFEGSKVRTGDMISRGPALPLQSIERDDRYLISEMACKSYEPTSEDGIGLEEALIRAYRHHVRTVGGSVRIGTLLNKETGTYIKRYHDDRQQMFEFSAHEVLDEPVTSEDQLRAHLRPIKGRFDSTRERAVNNTRLYLSAVGDLDAYVATSMRDRQDFYAMAEFCDKVFGDPVLRRYDLRYFDPTMSAADNHEDKGLIECLMVNRAKVLIYNVGDRDSFGKDAEAAMALSLGKPVIFYCTSAEKERFFKEVHPLSRLIDFATGVAVGAIVTDDLSEVVELLDRLFKNSMEYNLELKRADYLVLRESITGSVVRLQTSDKLLRETFWNHYQVSRDNRSDGELV